jgi:hypothetical protein
MSWDIFKENILRVANNPDGIPDIDTVARLYATEYDAAIKRGNANLYGLSVKQGNVEAMQNLFKAALQKGLNSTQPYDLVGEMGNGVLAYWGSAILNNLPVPVIPAPGSIANIAVTSASATNPGKWLRPISTANGISGDNPYDKLDWSKIKGIDKNDPEVRRITNPDPNTEKEKAYLEPLSDTDLEGTIIRTSQLNNLKDEILTKALLEQGIIKKEIVKDSDLKSGYNTLDELLRKAAAWARKLDKNPRVTYEHLILGYTPGIHGLCPQGAQAVLAALTGIAGLGSISGHADWFSFKEPGTDNTRGNQKSFAKPINGVVYYNDKVHIDSSYTLNPAKWQVGDIVAMGYTGGAPYGHIQVYTGFKWMSDFTQNRIQPNHVDESTTALWRLNENGKNAVRQSKNKSV